MVDESGSEWKELEVVGSKRIGVRSVESE